MIRKLMLPALVVALLGGCATSAYQYRGGQGDYYYGQPSTQYRYYGSPYGYYSPYGYSGYGYYGSPYGYYSPYGYSGYGYGFGGGFGYPYLPPHRHYRGDGHDHGQDGPGHHDHDDGDHDGDDHGDGRGSVAGDPSGNGQPPIDRRPLLRPGAGPDLRPGPGWRDPRNLGANPPDGRYRSPTIPLSRAPAPRRSTGGSPGSRTSDESPQATSAERKRRRTHEP